jgi:alpha-beta hydrolase superfamily lysophospholipase
VETFLVASALDHVHDPRARERFERARIIADELPAPAGRLLHLVNTRDVTALGPILLPHVTALAAEPSLSPERVPSPSAPVYLLHGSDDTVVPSAESALLARFLQERGVATHVLLTPLIVHAEVERPPGPMDLWRLIAFWKGLLEE